MQRHGTVHEFTLQFAPVHTGKWAVPGCRLRSPARRTRTQLGGVDCFEPRPTHHPSRHAA